MYYICCLDIENQKARMRKEEWQIENEYALFTGILDNTSLRLMG